ncbi:MAG: hypothetical protein ACUVXI_06145 [bacterium]
MRKFYVVGVVGLLLALTALAGCLAPQTADLSGKVTGEFQYKNWPDPYNPPEYYNLPPEGETLEGGEGIEVKLEGAKSYSEETDSDSEYEITGIDLGFFGLASVYKVTAVLEVGEGEEEEVDCGSITLKSGSNDGDIHITITVDFADPDNPDISYEGEIK